MTEKPLLGIYGYSTCGRHVGIYGGIIYLPMDSAENILTRIKDLQQ